MPTTAQRVFTRDELLASHAVEEPLLAGGIRCHGGFDGDGRYVSPRTAHRVPAIQAWQEHHRDLFGTDVIDVPLETWPENYPNIAQSTFLLSQGIRGPIAAILTRIGTVEGFGAFIRETTLPDIGQHFEEEIEGTALAHLGSGLFEAHGMDEAGSGDEGGHKQMWFAARDIAFENPFSEDQTAIILENMGIARKGSGGQVDLAALRAQAIASRLWPVDVDFDLEEVAARMARILLIEVQAFHTFQWAEELLSDPDLTAGDGTAATLVSFIRQDESPHIGYLRTALTEMRDRTFVGSSGRRYEGRDLLGTTIDSALALSLGSSRRQSLDFALNEIERHLDGHPRRQEILEEFHSLGSLRRDPAGTWRSTGDDSPVFTSRSAA